jgi:hypothetical protein
MKVNVLVLQRTPQPLNVDIVCPTAAAVHADLDTFLFQPASESFAGELAALVGIEDLGLAVQSERFVQRFDAEARVHGDRQSP